MSSSTTAVVVLFYRYFLPTPSSAPPEKSEDVDDPVPSAEDNAVAKLVDEATLRFFQRHTAFYLPLLLKYQQELCQRLSKHVKGRILLSREGINGTLSCPSAKELNEYMKEMEEFDLISNLGLPSILNDGESSANDQSVIPKLGGGRLFAKIDWKTSTVNDHKKSRSNDNVEPFPDLKIQVVKEIVNTGGTIHVEDIPKDTGNEISPREFHQILMEARQGGGAVMASSQGDNNVSSESKGSCCETSCINKSENEKKEVVLIDVRNTFEHSIGHFIHPHSNSILPGDSSKAATASQNAKQNAGESNSEPPTNKAPTPALNPNTVTFSHFDTSFCARYSDTLKDKKVLMYCTGGIRCVKASAMLKQRGVEDVSHLSGGIHRYVEQYGNDGFYKGKVFVFDQRVALDPDLMISKNNDNDGKVDMKHRQEENDVCKDKEVVGKCIECQNPYDQISGSTLCTVCRDLVLLCPTCKSSLNEFHCERHQPWKDMYFTFLERFSPQELRTQHKELQILHDTTYAKGHKNARRTLRKQIGKVLARIKDLEEGRAVLDRNAKKQCRTCFESEDVCDGLCWGFWRSHQSPHQTDKDVDNLDPILPVKVGDRVSPGSNWNVQRNGSRCYLAPESRPMKKKRMEDIATCQLKSNASDGNRMKVGTVIEVKPWASGGNEMDCVAVLWDDDPDPRAHGSTGRRKRKCRGTNKKNNDNATLGQSGIHRWGTVARNGKRMYDVTLIP